MGLFDRFKPARDEPDALQPEVVPANGDDAAHQTATQPDEGRVAAGTVGVETGLETVEPVTDFSVADSAVASSEAVSEQAQAPQSSVVETPAPFVDFEQEFAPLESSTEETAIPAPSMPELSGSALDVAELEEWSEPLPSVAPPVLALGSSLEAPEAQLRIESLIETRGGENVYLASYEGEGETCGVRLREASGVWGERLAREAMWRTHWDATARIAMLPRQICSFKGGENFYLATETLAESPTLSQFLALEEAKFAQGGEADTGQYDVAAYLTEVLLVLTQLAAFLVRLHGAGFAHLGLRPDGIVPGKPLQILDCSFAAPLGEVLEAPLSFAGYSAPELSHPGVVDARSDLYAVGALLYRAVSGQDVPESGTDFSTWQPRIVMAGVPQILRRTLGGVDTRYNSAEELHRALVKLKSRLRPTVSHASYGLSTIGLESTRASNQDAFGITSGSWETEQGPVAWTAFCVSDGMGGMAAGEVASEVAVGAFLRSAASWSTEAAGLGTAPLPAAAQAQLVKEWASAANEAVVRAMEARHARGGCTIDAGLVIDRRLCIAHVGDARMYLLRGGEFQVLSRDHSFVMSLLLQGQITFDDIRTHPERNKITRSLGERHPQPDYFVDGLQVQTGQDWLELASGDVLLACSDGLWEPVLESEMLEAIAGGDLAGAARQMLRLALQRGAPDNATLVLLRLDEHSAPVFA